MKFLIIEDDPKIIDVIKMTLKMRWPKTIVISTERGLEGIDLVAREKPNLIILDLGLPDIDGLDVLKQIKEFSDAPVMILSVRRDETDVVEGLEMGAEEYITKPFRQMEFLSRIQCIIRRKHSESNESPITAGTMNFLPAKRRLIMHDRDIVLTTTESRLFERLLEDAGHALSTETLAQSIWGTDYPGSNEAIHVYIHRLRQKIETDASKPQVIINLPGMGYILQVPE